MSSLRELTAARDAARFAGRDRELALLERVLSEDPPASVVLIHGPGGVGKSTLVRETVRRAAARGWTVATVDGRDPAARLDPALDALAGTERPLLVIDTYERVAALGGQLRGDALARMPAATRVLIAGRAAPDAGWSQDGWDAITLELPLGALGDADAHALLARRGIDDPAVAAELVGWAGGLPLALAVGADAAVTGATPVPGQDADAQLASTLLRRLAGDELEGGDRDVLAVAAIAVAVDPRLLGAVLPGVDGDHADAWLRSLSFAEPHGARVALHERVRAALRRDLRTREPEHERALRRAVADHLHDRAQLGEHWLIAEIAALIDDPDVRWGFTAATDRYRIDDVRPGDGEEAAAALGAQDTAWWAGVQRFIDEAPDRVAVVREATGALAGICVAVTPQNAPPWAGEDALLGPWLSHARTAGHDGTVLLWRDAIDLTAAGHPEGASPVAALLNSAAARLCGTPNVRCFYGAVDAASPAARRMSAAIGAVHLPELDVQDGERRVECHVLDHGPGGLVATARTLVYRDLGLPPPAARPDAPPGVETVRDALRAFHDPLTLAASPLARGADGAARATSVRTLLRQAVGAAFGDSPDELLQRRILERGYLDPDGGHTRAALELHLSRTTYFRRLAAAADRVATYVLDERFGGVPGG